MRLVRRFRSLSALFLLALWLPATLHCDLEAAGLLAQQCADECAAGQTASNDGCGVVESGLYKTGTEVVKVPAPELLACHFSLPVSSLVEFTEPAAVPVQSAERPLDWVTTWRFVRRAAPSPRDPSLSLA